MSFMRTGPRPRHYVSGATLSVTRPILRYSSGRDAYVLRVVGSRFGPVLRPDRRRRQLHYGGSERRHGNGVLL